jgi:hypothetical protein
MLDIFNPAFRVCGSDVGKLFVKRAFSGPKTQKPEHLIYDSNCQAKQQALANGDHGSKM